MSTSARWRRAGSAAVLCLFVWGSVHLAAQDPQPKGTVNTLIFHTDRQAITIADHVMTAWEVTDPASAAGWVKRRVWENHKYYTFNLCGGPCGLLITADATELLQAGAWDTPLLTRAGGLPSSARSITNIIPPRQNEAAWWGLAIQEETTDGGDSRWDLFQTTPGAGWHRLVLPGIADTAVRNMLRIAPGEIAVAVTGATGRSEWRLFRMNDSGWEGFAPAGAPSPIAAVQVVAAGQGLGLQSSASSGAWTWYVSAANQTFVPIAGAVGRSFGEVPSIWISADGTLLGVDSDAPNELQRLYFHRGAVDQRWQRLEESLQLTGSVAEAKPFAGGRGVAFRRRAGTVGRADSTWTLRYWASDHRWVDFLEMLPNDVPHSGVWDVEEAGAGRTVGIRWTGVPDDKTAAYKWTWYVHDAAHDTWSALSTRLGTGAAANRDIWRLFGDTPDLSVVTEDIAARERGATSQWQWFSAVDGTWRSLPELVPALAGMQVKYVEDRQRGRVIGVTDDSGWYWWFVRTGNTYTLVNDFIGARRP